MEKLLEKLNAGGEARWEFDNLGCVPHLTCGWLKKDAGRKAYRAAAETLKRDGFSAFELRFCETEIAVNLRILVKSKHL